MHIKNFDIKIGAITLEGTRIVEWSGLQEMTAEYELAKNALSNGTIVMGTYIPEREIYIKARVARNNADATLRYFKPYKDLVLQVAERKANVRVQKAKLTWEHGMYNDPFIELDIIAPDPFFYDVSDFGQDLAGVEPLFSFPWTYSPDNPLSFGYRKFTDKTVFRNDGDESVGVKFRIEALGTVTNVKVENLKTKQFLRVRRTLNRGDVLELSTVGGDSYIRLNNEDIFNDIDRMSNFFKMDVGDNFLQYSAEEGVTEMQIYLYYTPKYLSGVEDIEI